MSFDIDKEEFYETFYELQDAQGSQRALEWAWSALEWTQQELRKEAVKNQSIAAEERAAVVAWLRANTCGCYDFASAIERGEHRREEEK